MPVMEPRHTVMHCTNTKSLFIYLLIIIIIYEWCLPFLTSFHSIVTIEIQTGNAGRDMQQQVIWAQSGFHGHRICISTNRPLDFPFWSFSKYLQLLSRWKVLLSPQMSISDELEKSYITPVIPGRRQKPQRRMCPNASEDDQSCVLARRLLMWSDWPFKVE